ncbi:DUF3365 domain-containing protein [bacterium]|nr:DUF3365 domain-containing protein [bacterium]
MRILTILAATMLLAGCSGNTALDEGKQQQAEAKARDAAQELAGTLMGEVQKAMKENGPSGAVLVCAEKAQPLTNEIADRYGVTLRRVTTKPRNPLDAPDDYEQNILAHFASMQEKGTLDFKTTHSETVTENGIQVLRFMKPLTIKKPCLACHAAAEELDANVRQALADRYPDDQATGYSAGDLRGAISVTVPLQ